MKRCNTTDGEHAALVTRLKEAIVLEQSERKADIEHFYQILGVLHRNAEEKDKRELTERLEAEERHSREACTS